MCEASETCGGRPLPMEAAVGRVLDSKFLVPAAPTFCEGRDRFGEPEGVSPRTSPCCETSGGLTPNGTYYSWSSLSGTALAAGETRDFVLPLPVASVVLHTDGNLNQGGTP